MVQVMLRAAIWQTRGRWNAFGGDMHLAQPAGREAAMLLDRIRELFAARILQKQPTIFRLWFVDTTVKGQTRNGQMWQDLFIDNLLDVRGSFPTSLGDDCSAAGSHAVKPINA